MKGYLQEYCALFFKRFSFAPIFHNSDDVRSKQLIQLQCFSNKL